MLWSFDIDWAGMASTSGELDADAVDIELAGYTTWNKINTASESAAMAVVNTEGLNITPAAASAYDGVDRTAPMLGIAPQALLARFDPTSMGLRIWNHFSADNSADDFDSCVTAIDTGSIETAFFALRQFDAAQANDGSIVTGVCKNSAVVAPAGVNVTLGAANRVICLDVPDVLRHTAKVSYGTYSGGWPALHTMTAANQVDATTSTSRRVDGVDALDPSTWMFWIGAARATSGTSLEVTVARTRFEIYRRY